MLLLPEDPSTCLIMVATGSGIAPYRTFWRRLFMEDVPNYKFTGGWTPCRRADSLTVTWSVVTG